MVLEEAQIGIIFVEQHPSRPVIAIRQEGEIREGDIFFRYPGQSARIKYSDLRAILDDRDARARAMILPMVERLLSLGPTRAMIADLEAGGLTDGKRTIQIDEGLLDKITFIKSGEFDEEKGAPTLRLVGDVKVTGSAPPSVVRGVITSGDLISDFLEQSTPLDPAEYVRFALEGSNGEWLPIRYFAKMAGMTKGALLEFIDTTNASANRKRLFTDRVNNRDAARRLKNKVSAMILDDLREGNRPHVATSKEAGTIGVALQTIPRETEIGLPLLLRVTADCWHVAEGVAASAVRRAACRIDEIFFDLTDD